MKKVILTGLTLLLLLVGCGYHEAGIATISVNTKDKLGSSEIELSIKYNLDTQGLLIIERPEGFELYNGGAEPEIIAKTDIQKYNTINGLFTSLIIEGNKNDKLGEDFPEGRFPGNFYLSTAFDSSPVANDFPNDSGQSFIANFSVLLGARLDTRILLLSKMDDTTKAIAYDGEIVAEFFNGEDLFFTRIDENNESTYEEKAIAFLSTFWKTDALYNDLKNNIKSSFTIPGNDLRTAMLNDSNITAAKNEFRKAMIRHFQPEAEDKEADVKRYFGAYTSYFFDNIYGTTGNPYVGAYLLYCFKKSKPVLSKVIESQLENMDEVGYNYRDYESFAVDGGILSFKKEGDLIAENALRYLTWGVDYTPFSTGNQYRNVTQPIKDVYPNVKEQIDNWVDGDHTNRENNYLPNGSDIKKIDNELLTGSTSDNSNTHILTGNFKSNTIYLNGWVKPDLDLQITQVDLWTAENIAWRENSIKRVSYLGTGYISSDMGKRLYNKNIFSETIVPVMGYTPDNAPGTDTFELGYEFNKTERVGGIVLAYKKRHLTGNVPDNRNMDVQIKIANGNWISLDFQEYNYWVDDKSFYNETYEGGNGKGYTLVEDLYKDSTSDEAYYYIVLNNIVECTAVKVIYTAGATNLEVDMTEMMVFDNNPIKYLVPNKKVTTFSSIFSSHDYYREGNNLTGDFAVVAKDTFMELNIQFAGDTIYDIETVALWEKPASGTDTAIQNGSFTISDQPLNREFLKPYSFADILNSNNLEFTTPYVKNGERYPGNPLPYLPMGIDTPRTFAYKMREQYRAKQFYRENINNPFGEDRIFDGPSLKAVDTVEDENYYEGYVFQSDVNSIPYRPEIASLKPYLPGWIASSESGYINDTNNQFVVDKLAGVDSMGILMGSLAMLSGGNNVEVNNYFSKETSEEVDKYTALSTSNRSLPGIDWAGNPDFSPLAGNSILDGNYRFTKADIERSTILVPELDLIQKGDLLVQYNSEDKEIHTGIVVAFDTGLLGNREHRTKEDIEKFMQSVAVVSVRRGFQMATLGTWGNPENGFGGFTSRPENYHLRRLLKKTKDNGAPAEDPWELIEYRIEKLDCDIAFADDEWGHYIPNTNDHTSEGQLEKVDFNVTIKGMVDEDISDFLTGSNRDIKLLAPRDYGFSAFEADVTEESNLNTNKGAGIIFYVKNPETEVYYELARFEKKTAIDVDTITEDTYYEVEYKSDFFHTTGDNEGETLDDVRLFAGAQGVLRFESDLEDFNFDSIDFAVTAIDGGAEFRPGDDYLLRFGLAKDDEIAGVVKTEDFMACYDKKMIWRANLYIVENANDWNNEYPWNAPRDENNWNLYHDGTTAFTNISDLPVANQDSVQYNGQNIQIATPGGQNIAIASHRPYRGAGDRDDRVTYSWPYTIGNIDMDGPFDFNKKLIITRTRNNINTTTPPNGNYHEYSDGHDTNNNRHYVPGLGLYDFDMNGDVPPPISQVRAGTSRLNIGQYPHADAGLRNNENSMDGLTVTFQEFDDKGDNDRSNDEWLAYNGPFLEANNAANPNVYKTDYEFEDNIYSAGTDCIGFAQRTASYGGNTYDWWNLPEMLGAENEDDRDNSNRTYPYIGDFSWSIASSNEVNDQGDFIGLNKVVPGDIVFYCGQYQKRNAAGQLLYEAADGSETTAVTEDPIMVDSDGSTNADTGRRGSHIMVVQHVVYSDDNRNPGVAEIHLIESTFAGTRSYVMNHQTMNDYRNRNWYIVRLKK